ncbi:MAG: hypothetical protein ACK4IY_09345, partial [Chitinophagales bacterium]
KVLFVFGLILSLMISGCSTDFDLNADFKETPVVYGLLDPTIATNYIRINRAYLSDDVDALTLAADPNAIYYGAELVVTLEIYNNGAFVGSQILERVDGDTLGIPKDSGTFANIPNILYRYKEPLNQDFTYKLIAQNTETGKTVTSETPIINQFKITRPNEESIFPQAVSISPGGFYQLAFGNAADAVVYDITMRFHYREATYIPASDEFTDVVSKYIDWKFVKNLSTEGYNAGEQITYDIQGSGFYNFIKNSFEANPDPMFVRLPDSVQFFIEAGGEALFNYLQFSNATLGLNEGQVTADYTNVDGGLGILSGRFLKVSGIYPFTIQTRDSIACSSITQGLNFAPDQSNGSFPCCE